MRLIINVSDLNHDELFYLRSKFQKAVDEYARKPGFRDTIELKITTHEDKTVFSC